MVWKTSRWRIVSAILALSLFLPTASAEIIKYRDKLGVWHLANRPSPATQSASRHRHSLAAAHAYQRPSQAANRTDVLHCLERYSKKYDLDPKLAKAVATAESNFNSIALSPAGAMGVMQLMPDTAKRFNVSDPYDINQNIEAGIRYLRELIAEFGKGNLEKVVAAYHCGENRVKRHDGIPPIPATRTYVARVLRLYNGREIPDSDYGMTIISYRDRRGVLHLTNRKSL